MARLSSRLQTVVAIQAICAKWIVLIEVGGVFLRSHSLAVSLIRLRLRM